MPTNYAGTAQERSALGAYIKLWRAAHLVEAEANRHLADYDLTVSQFGALEALYHLGPMSQRRLGKKILRSSGNLTMVIDNLVKAKLARRDQDTVDRRVMNVSLTEAGHDLVARVLPPHVQGIVDVFSVLSERELSTLASLTRKLGLALSGGEADKE